MMKVLMIQAALLWLAIVAEHSRTDLVPSYSLLLPCCSICLAMRKSTSSIAVIGLALLIQDLLRMESQPVVTVGLLFISTFAATRSEPDPMSRRHNSKAGRFISDWFFLPAIIFAGGTLLHFGYRSRLQFVTFAEVQSYLVVATPVFLIAIVALRISQEFGFRYSIN